MVARISHCGDIVGGFCGDKLESGGLESLQLLYYSYIYLAFVYAIMTMILSMHTTGSPGGGREGGDFKGAFRNPIMIYTHILLTKLRREIQFILKNM